MSLGLSKNPEDRFCLHEAHIIPLFYPIVHRIGRTGRCGKTGLATTFINKAVGKLPCDPFFVVKFYIGTFFRLSVSIIGGILFPKCF